MNRHPNIEESCVFGIKLSELEEVVCAWVKLRDKSLGTTVDDIRAFCKENFADVKIPRYIKIVDEFTEQNTLGKLQRMKIADMYRQECKSLNHLFLLITSI